MARCMVPAALALGILATSLPSAAQPARQPAPPPPTAGAVVGARKVDDDRAVKRRNATLKERRALLEQRRASVRRASEKMAQLTDEQVAAQLQELTRKASVKEGEYYQARMEAKDIREAHDAAPDEQKPDLFVLQVETNAKSRVLQVERKQLAHSVQQMIQEQVRRHRKQIEGMTDDQLKAHLRDLVGKRNAVKRRCDDLKVTAREREGSHTAAVHAANVELTRLNRKVRDAESAYHLRLKEMIQEQSRRHGKQIEGMTNDQLKAHLRDLVAKRNAAKRRHDDLKVTAKEREGGHTAADSAAALEIRQLNREVGDAEGAYYQRLTAQ